MEQFRERHFVNFSNHPSQNWDEKQKNAALLQYRADTIEDILFPAVSPAAGEAELHVLAEECVKKILSSEPAAVMVQGEFGLAFMVVKRLMDKGIPAVYACSERKVKETVTAEGKYRKEVSFDFVRFRRYEL